MSDVIQDAEAQWAEALADGDPDAVAIYERMEADDRTVTPLCLTPGAMEHTLRRELADGSLIEFESAPVGWLKKDGEPRRASWRAYHFTPSDAPKRTRFVSVTTLNDSICPKPGLPPWAEARGIEGARAAFKAGLVELHHDGEEWIAAVREARLGADAARDEAADRGLDMHAFLERYMRTGSPPAIREYPLEQHGYVKAGARWLLKHKPEPVQIEELICDPEGGYAGRSDLVALIGGLRTRVDFKTSENAAIYSSSHLQVGLYERGAVACGDEPTDQQQIVVLAADGEFRPMLSEATPERIDAALAYYRAIKPIDSLCESANRAEKKARA